VSHRASTCLATPFFRESLRVIREISIQNYKSIEKLKLELGRVNVLIGENGAGKSNLLEAVAIASAASAGKLDNEFLASRGIRVTQPELMRSGFRKRSTSQPIEILVQSEGGSSVKFVASNDNTVYSKWMVTTTFRPSSEKFSSAINPDDISEFIQTNVEIPDQDVFFADMRLFIEAVSAELLKRREVDRKSTAKNPGPIEKLMNVDNSKGKLMSSQDIPFNPTGKQFKYFLDSWLYDRMVDKEISNSNEFLSRFVVFAPEYSQLRQFDQEGQIEPLGINGQGLFKLLQFISASKNVENLTAIKAGLSLLGWFKDFSVIFDKLHGRLEIRDQYLARGLKYLDQRSANEGFLFLLFYFTLFSSELTPSFFGVDNLDTSFNPKLCQKLMAELIILAKNNDKQTLITTHNPAVLDGLNLDDDAQRLFVLYRGDRGQSMVRRVKKPEKAGSPIRLSEAFLRGSLGGLPKGF
jgi:predicted ATPase